MISQYRLGKCAKRNRHGLIYGSVLILLGGTEETMKTDSHMPALMPTPEIQYTKRVLSI
jgi:hypothetical protein